MVFIDSDLIIKYMQNKRTPIHIRAQLFLEKLWFEHEKIFITEYNYAELIRGAYLSANVGESLKAVQNFCQKFEIIYSNANSILEYAQISANLQLKGEKVGDIDELIASIVIQNNDLIYSHHLDHFKRIPALQVQDWVT